VAKPRQVLQLEWGRALARLMASSGDCKTQCALAERSGVAQATIGRILRGKVNPQTDTMAFLARALGTPLRTLAAVAEGENAAEQLEVDCAFLEALACREERKRGEQTLESLRRKENEAIERLQKLVREGSEYQRP
jgi:transcriptional regulator with XRE-family HTH domain